MRRVLARAFAASAIAMAGVIGVSSGTGVLETPSAMAAPPASCQANDNLLQIADTFISQCRKGSIRREFPAQRYSNPLSDIKRGRTGSFKTAWKLLNDGRFAK